MNTTRAIEVLRARWPDTKSTLEELSVACDLGAAALEREEKLRELVVIWRRNGWPIFACDAIESVLNGKKP